MNAQKTTSYQHVILGAVWPAGDHYLGPALHTGSDGSRVTLFRVQHGGDTGLLALDMEHVPDGLPESLQARLASAGWTVESARAIADEAASYTPHLPVVNARSCASTGVLLTGWIGGSMWPSVSYVSVAHGLTELLG